MMKKLVCLVFGAASLFSAAPECALAILYGGMTKSELKLQMDMMKEREAEASMAARFSEAEASALTSDSMMRGHLEEKAAIEAQRAEQARIYAEAAQLELEAIKKEEAHLRENPVAARALARAEQSLLNENRRRVTSAGRLIVLAALFTAGGTVVLGQAVEETAVRHLIHAFGSGLSLGIASHVCYAAFFKRLGRKSPRGGGPSPQG